MDETILLVLNSKLMQTMMEKRLRSEGFYVVVAADVEEALILLSKIKFNMIIIGYKRCEKSFAEQCCKLLMDWNIPVMFCLIPAKLRRLGFPETQRSVFDIIRVGSATVH